MAGDRESEYPFHGVKHHRRLTDIPCCVIFVGWVFFAFVTIGQSFAQGNLDAYAPRRPARGPRLTSAARTAPMPRSLTHGVDFRGWVSAPGPVSSLASHTRTVVGCAQVHLRVEVEV